MRNLKKILAMVLALVMSLSLMATAGAAQFPDVDDSNPYKTAIDVLDELKVFQGFEDGTFKPTDTLNRAQAAVLVYRIATGDVENKYLDNYTYMQQSKFNDLDGYNWAKGYINYCQNAGIVVGTSATTFNPGAPVTGYQLMVMLLRTLGYGKAGEFTDPKGWELQTAAIAEREGILKNVTGGDFGAPAPRQMVAEILFRGILHDTVEYSPLTPGGYTESGVSLGKKTLGLDDIEGVVVANRIADLYDTEPMKDGQTRMIVDGKDYVIDMDTDASAIGLNHHAYVQNGKVLGSSLEAEGNAIGEPEHGEAAKVADLAKAAGIKTNADTDYYVNFDEAVSDTSNYRLEYLIGLEMTEAEAASLVARNGGAAWVDNGSNAYKFERGTELGFYWDNNDDFQTSGSADVDGATRHDFLYDKVIPAKETISSTDSRYMKEIFVWSDSKGGDTTSDDLFFGEVYVGTKSKLEEDDISDDISHDEFIEKYINVNENRTISSSDNGEWLRVIDNNGDGVAEYVLRTDFVMTTVTDYEKRTDTYVVEWEGDLPNGNGKGTIKADAIRPVNGGEAADMSIGSVILYTLIDGYYYISNPVAQSMTIDKKSIDSKKGTFTVDGEGYTWSGIEEAAERYYDSLANLAYETKYDMYPDHFGFIRLATETTRNFVLLTDGWFYTDNRNDEYKADLYNGETFVEGVEVVDKARKDANWNGDGFIDTYEADHKGNRGTWLRLNTFGEYYWISHVDNVNAPTEGWQHYTDKDDIKYTNGVYSYTDSKGIDWNLYRDPFITNIALGSEADGKWTLEDVTDPDVQFNGLYRDYHAYELAGTNNAYYDSVKQRTVKAKTTDLWGVTDWTDDAHVVADTTAIQANGSTLYYLVQNPGAKDQSVISWVGYQNVPESVGNFVAERAYAVTRDVRTANVDYEIAEVVVFEGIYSKAVKNPQLITRGNTTRSEYALGKDDEGAYIEHYTTFKLFNDNQLRTLNSPVDDGICAPQIRFYDPAEEEYIDQLDDATYADYGIYAGKAKVLTDTKGNDYIQMIWDSTLTQTSKRFTFYMEQVEAYELNQLTGSGRDGYANKNLEVNETYNIRQDDQLIIVVDGDDNVKMVVNVSGSGKDGNTLRHDGADAAIGKLVELYGEIVYEEKNPAVATVTVKYGALPTGVTVGQPTIEKNGKDYTVTMPTVAGGYTWKVVPSADSKGNYENVLKGDGNEWIVTNMTGNVTLEATLEHGTDGTLTLTYTATTGITDLAVKFDDVEQTVKATTVAYDAQPVGTKVNVSFKLAAGQKSVNLTGTSVELTETDGVYSFELYLPTGATNITITTTANEQIPITYAGTGISGTMSMTTGVAGQLKDLNGLTLKYNGEAIDPATQKFTDVKIETTTDGTTYTVVDGSKYSVVAATGVITCTNTTPLTGVTGIRVTAAVEAITGSVTVVIGVDGSGKKVAKITDASVEAVGDTYPVALGDTLTLTIAPDEGNATGGRFAVTGDGVKYDAETGVITVGPVNGDVIVNISDATGRNLSLTTDINTQLIVTVDGSVKKTIAANTTTPDTSITVYPGQTVKLICQPATAGYHAAPSEEFVVEAGDGSAISKALNAVANTGTGIKTTDTAKVAAVDVDGEKITLATGQSGTITGNDVKGALAVDDSDSNNIGATIKIVDANTGSGNEITVGAVTAGSAYVEVTAKNGSTVVYYAIESAT